MALTEPYQETLDLKWDHIATELSSYMVTSEKILMSIRKVYPVNIERIFIPCNLSSLRVHRTYVVANN